MSKIISYDYGHLEGGQDTSANGILYEYRVNRDYGARCIDYLTQAGYTCINCTPPDNQGYTLSQSLVYRTEHANASGSILHLCFHANAFQMTDKPMGAEIEIAPICSDTSVKVAQSVLTEICKLGFINRGVNRPNLWVTKNTNMPAILVESLFIDSKADCNLYSSDKMGKAIAQGVLNVLGGSIPNIVPSQPSTPTPTPTPQPIQPRTWLQLGDCGERVSELQAKLNRLGYSLKVDGSFGKLTQSAVINFQSKNGLVTDGYFGMASQNKLDSLIAELDRPKPTPKPQGSDWIRRLQTELNNQEYTDENGNRLDVDGCGGNHTHNACAKCVLTKGCHGEITRLVQEKLVAMGYNPNGIDGIFGNGMYNCVIKLQRDYGLSQDASIGRQTWGVLLSH